MSETLSKIILISLVDFNINPILTNESVGVSAAALIVSGLQPLS